MFYFSTIFKRWFVFSFRAPITTSACHLKDVLTTKEAQIVDNNLVIQKPEELQQQQKLAGKITVPTKVSQEIAGFKVGVYLSFSKF